MLCFKAFDAAVGVIVEIINITAVFRAIGIDAGPAAVAGQNTRGGDRFLARHLPQQRVHLDGAILMAMRMSQQLLQVRSFYFTF